VDNITFKVCDGSSLPESIPHMPFLLKAIESSVTKRIASGQSLPDYREGYDDWRTAFSDKKAGIYVVQIGDAVSVAEEPTGPELVVVGRATKSPQVLKTVFTPSPRI